MIEAILSRDNLLTALKRVESNKGSHGVEKNARTNPTATDLQLLAYHQRRTETGNL
ncbi:hypothetical protein ABID56_001571 [Alkalibacillus flavidus]|uniref:Uncharacterized protein n=1 Tax=Alkalibacillus flavidus TaxID=546021 RepID=A0ABV2KV86_9BACI